MSDIFIRDLGSGRTIIPSELKPVVEAAKGDGVIEQIGKTTTLYAAYEREQLVGMCGAIWYSGSAKFKNAVVLPEYRGQGIYHQMIQYRLALAVKKNVKTISAICTEMSLPTYIKYGFEPIRYYENWKLTYVRITL